jgi:hypothetical protein
VPCRDSYPILKRLHERYSEEGVDIVLFVQGGGAWSDNGESANVTGSREAELTIPYFFKKMGATSLIAFDTAMKVDTTWLPGQTRPGSPESGFARDYGLFGFPDLVILDREGVVRARFAGAFSEKYIETVVRKLLARP